jgi:hypothetical protein
MSVKVPPISIDTLSFDKLLLLLNDSSFVNFEKASTVVSENRVHNEQSKAAQCGHMPFYGRRTARHKPNFYKFPARRRDQTTDQLTMKLERNILDLIPTGIEEMNEVP